MVATLPRDASPITVQSSVVDTLDQRASIRRSPPSGSPVRRNTMPVLAVAGCRHRVTGALE